MRELTKMDKLGIGWGMRGHKIREEIKEKEEGWPTSERKRKGYI